MKENNVKKVLTAIEDIDRIKLVLKLYKANQLTEDEALEMIRSDEQFHRASQPLYPITYPVTSPGTGTPWNGGITYTTGSFTSTGTSGYVDTTNGAN